MFTDPIAFRHNGHRSPLATRHCAHRMQDTTCPQGVNDAVLTSSQQMTQSLTSSEFGSSGPRELSAFGGSSAEGTVEGRMPSCKRALRASRLQETRTETLESSRAHSIKLPSTPCFTHCIRHADIFDLFEPSSLHGNCKPSKSFDSNVPGFERLLEETCDYMKSGKPRVRFCYSGYSFINPIEGGGKRGLFTQRHA
jgi:hypothetical protein